MARAVLVFKLVFVPFYWIYWLANRKPREIR